LPPPRRRQRSRSSSAPSAPSDDALLISALVIDRDGTIAGFQDKVQLDPSEEWYVFGRLRERVFQAGPLTFGVAICHEGWRYPENGPLGRPARRTRRVPPSFPRSRARRLSALAFRRSCQLIHEKAALCRAAENTCFFRDRQLCDSGSPTTSAVVRPDGTLLGYQPYGQRGLLIADIDIAEATGLLAARCKPPFESR